MLYSPHSRLHFGDPQLQQISKCIFQFEHSIAELIHPDHSKMFMRILYKEKMWKEKKLLYSLCLLTPQVMASLAESLFHLLSRHGQQNSARTWGVKEWIQVCFFWSTIPHVITLQKVSGKFKTVDIDYILVENIVKQWSTHSKWPWQSKLSNLVSLVAKRDTSYCYY